MIHIYRVIEVAAGKVKLSILVSMTNQEKRGRIDSSFYDPINDTISPPMSK